MLSNAQKQMYLEQLRQFQHAMIDDEVVFVEARRKADGQHVLLGCIQRAVELPPMVLGGEPQRVVNTIPIFEFIDLGDGSRIMPNPYEPVEPDLVGAEASTIATGADVVREAATLAG